MIGIPIAVLCATYISACSAQRIIIGTTPVEQRIVEMQLDALFMAFVGKLFDDIAFERSGIDNVVRRLLGAKHRKSVVMSRCDANIFCTCRFYIRHPFGCIEFRRIKAFGQLGVFFVVDVFVVHDPLAVGHHTVYAPMDEYSEFHILKFPAVFEIFRRRSVALLCGCARCDEEKRKENAINVFH